MDDQPSQGQLLSILYGRLSIGLATLEIQVGLGLCTDWDSEMIC